MSSVYWSILGFGYELSQADTDYRKVLELMGFVVPEEKCDEELLADIQDSAIDWSDIAEAIAETDPNRICTHADAGRHSQTFVMLFPEYSWSRSDFQIETEDQAREIVFQTVRPYVKDKVSDKELMDQIVYINTAGED